MIKYRKKPVVIEAFRWLLDETPLWWSQLSKDFNVNVLTQSVYIKTLEGTMECRKGDWIIKGVNGEFYPCKPDIFEKTYEKVED